MDSLQSKIPVSTMTVYFGILKEPRGLIRLLQFIFAIFAFATACSGGSNLSIQDNTNTQVVGVSWSYPYYLGDTQINTNSNTTQSTLSLSNDIQSSAQFFVFTGVTSMLLTLGFLIVYVFLDLQYRNDERFPIVDLLITLIWMIFWIAGSSAWAQGVTNIRSQTSFDYVSSLVPDCSNTTYCATYDSGTYANITVSVIFGFLNFLLWFGCIWFVYKETKFFRNRTAQQHPQQNNFSNIAAPNIQQQQQQPPRVPSTMS